VGLSKQIDDFRQRAIADHAPPAALVAGTVRVVSYEGQRTLLDVDSAGCTLLVSSDVNWPGWRAFANGRRIATVTVNGAFLGCYLPAGHTRVELVYEPDEFINGARAGIAGLVLLAAAYVTAARRRSSSGRPRSRAPSPFPGDAAS